MNREIARQHLLDHYRDIVADTTQMIRDLNAWNAQHSHERPIDASDVIVLRGLARRALGHVERWERVPVELVKRMQEIEL